MASRTQHHAMSNNQRLASIILFTTCLIPSIFGGLLLPDLGNLSEQDMEDLVYSLLANSGNNNLDMDTRSWDASSYPSYEETLYSNKRTPMQLDHSNPTTRLFTNNPYHKRSANMFSGMKSGLQNGEFINSLYKRSGFWDRLKRAEAEKRDEAEKREADKRSANMFSGMQSGLRNGEFINSLYKREAEKRSANMFSGMQSGLRNGEFINSLYKREAEKRSANMYSGMKSSLGNGRFINDLYKRSGAPEKRSANMFSSLQSGLQNNDFINGLYKRGDNYAYSPVTDLNAADYWNNLMNAYSRQNARYMYKRETKKTTSESDEKKTKPENAEKKEKKSDDSASPASL